MAKYSIETVNEAYEKSKAWAQAERYDYERRWFRNVLFFLGIQWIVYNPKTNRWKPRDLKPWVPRPVTNKFASVANTVMQVLSSKTPNIRATPGTDSPEDIAAALVADRNFDVILDEMDYETAKGLSASWLTLTGSVILHPCYDRDEQYGTSFLQSVQCKSCRFVFSPDQMGKPVPLVSAPSASPMATDVGAKTNGSGAQPSPLPLGAEAVLPNEQELSEGSCPKCGSPQIGPAYDQNQEAIGEDVAIGKSSLEVYSPFETFLDLEARSIKETDILTRRRYPLSYIQQRFNKPEIEPDGESNASGMLGLNLLRAIAYASNNVQWATGFASGRAQGSDQSITVDTLWKRPCPDFPEGLVAFYANNKLLNDGSVKEESFKDGLPYRDRKGKPIWNWHIINFDQVPGRIFGKTPLDDIAPKQEQRNKLEALIQLIIQRTANPVWLIAKGTGITEVTGEPGQLLEGNWAMDPKLKPERVSGENVPTSLIAWLEKIDSDIEELAGTFEVLRGNAPPGVTAGTALRLLLERANTRFTPVLERSEIGWQEVFQDALLIFQQYGSEERINKIQGPGNTWEVKTFTNADIMGAIDIRVERHSSVPKSTVGEQALVQDLIATGIINPQDPEVQYKILEKFSSTDLLGDTDLNIRYAQRENWAFTEKGVTPIIDPVIDFHPAHIMIHKQLALKSDFQSLPDPLKMAMKAHILEHMIAMTPAKMPAPTPETAGKSNGGAQGQNPNPREASAPPRQTQPEEGEPPLFPGA